MKSQTKKVKSEYVLLLLGIVTAVFMMLPYLILGQDSIVVYHDQLDGELLTYLLNAKYLFQGVDVFPEIMKGIPVAGLTMPAPGFVVLFALFEPFPAFMIMQFFVNLTAFLSMYFLAKEITGKQVPAFVTALLFMMLPFYPVYGLCIPGQPLFWLSLYQLSKAEKGQWKYYVAVAVYGLFSSLALVGFACIIVGIAIGTYLLIKAFCMKEKAKKKACYKASLREFLAVGVLSAVYGLCNINLVKQILLADKAFVSHKSEVVYQEIPFLNGFTDCFLEGVDYAESRQLFVLILMIIAFVVTLIGLVRTDKSKRKEQWLQCWKEYVAKITGLCVCLTGIALFYGVYHGKGMTALRNHATGILHDFNLDRVTWLMPVLWFVLMALVIHLLLSRSKKVIAYGIVFVVCGAMFLALFLGNGIKPNVAKLLKGSGNYTALTWKQFWAEDLYEEVEELIGKPQEEYYVVSYGIYPATAVYNGFYCLDAYSNNYDVEYKHAFRSVIAPELAKSEYLTRWYDEWGNRCYLVTVEKNNYFTFDKQTSAVAMTFDIDIEALKTLGCDYMISAAYIMDSEEKGMTLLNPEGIETQDSWYRLFVYKID